VDGRALPTGLGTARPSAQRVLRLLRALPTWTGRARAPRGPPGRPATRDRGTPVRRSSSASCAAAGRRGRRTGGRPASPRAG
jgi:hypothetical protein